MVDKMLNGKTEGRQQEIYVKSMFGVGRSLILAHNFKTKIRNAL